MNSGSTLWLPLLKPPVPHTRQGPVQSACLALLSYLPSSPGHVCSTKHQAERDLCFVGLSVAWEVSERWGWGVSGWGWVFQVELPLGVSNGSILHLPVPGMNLFSVCLL